MKTFREDTELDIMRWEDDGGAIHSEVLPVKRTGAQLKDHNSWEMWLVVFIVVGTHLLPFSGALGCPLFAADSYRSIEVLFALLAAFMLTMRVFQINGHLTQMLWNARKHRLWALEAIGAAVLLAWLAPIYAAAHAEASVAAMGVGVSVLGSVVVTNPTVRLNVGHDLATVFVVIIAVAWCHALPCFRTGNGEDFLGAVTIGSSSLHSLWTMIEMVAKARAK